MLSPTMWALFALMSAPSTSHGGAAVGAASNNHYAILNVNHSADALEIRSAYRRAALFAHPDKGGSTEAFNLIGEAFNILSCPRTRALYDLELMGNLQNSISRGSKRSCEDASARRNATLRIGQALKTLRDILQQMGKALRNDLMSSIPLEVQKALMEFIKSGMEPEEGASECPDRHSKKSTYGCIRLQTKAHATSGSKSYAQLDIEYLRLYTRWTKIETAIEHQLVLSKVQDCLVAASDVDLEFWSKSDEVCRVVDDAFSDLGISRTEFGVSVYVQMRAPEWVANCHRITSPVVPLETAVALRSQLLRARSTSWESLRAEWIKLLQGGKFGRSAEEATKHVDQARRSFIEQQLPNAVQIVKKALGVQEEIDKKTKFRIEIREKRQAEKEAAKNAKPRGKKRTILNPSNSSDDGENATTWPYLSAKRLRAHEMACESNRASTTV